MANGAVDPLVLGQRIRHFRRLRSMTLDQLGDLVGRPAPYLSLIENGKREPRIGLINDVAAALDIPAVELLSAEAPSRRADLEVRLERAQQHPLYEALDLPHLKPSAKLPDVALEHILTLFDEMKGSPGRTLVTREEARIANSELRDQMQAADNYFGEIERVAAAALEAIDYSGAGSLTERDIQNLAGHFSFGLVRAQDVPPAVRSVTDLKNRLIYVPQRDLLSTRGARSVVLQTIGRFALTHSDPTTFGEYLRQQVEANYFAGAILVPEAAAVEYLSAAKAERDLAIEDMRDAYYVSYEMAAHRFTNLATEHLGLHTHFIRSDELGTTWKAYANNGLELPKNSVGAIEGQRLCRQWGARQAFHSEDKFSMHYQYTDTSEGSFWCGTHIDADSMMAITVGASFDDAQFFRGRDTDRHATSNCPDGDCCRRPPNGMAERWSGYSWPSVRPNSHILAAMPIETIPGVDMVEVYEFLDRHADD
ncbi:MAG: helix-turn-helix domain-containing protein [Acidimicrobiia bacterium]|nr:helix-turn-helix domain-containing protein [Acidimicrobiia bacterium]